MPRWPQPEKPSSPGTLLPGGILIADEPAHAGVTVFAGGGVLLTLNLRPGGNVGQIIVGLSANQALQVAERLTHHADLLRKTISEGKGGARFPDKAKE
jgi:hypothetical protein